MDSTSSRPPDSIPTMDDHVYPPDHNLSYDHIFIARVSDIIKTKRNAYKQNLLRELRHLRHLILAAIPEVSLTSPSEPSTRDQTLDPNPNSPHDDNSEHLFAHETLDITSHAALSSHQLLRQLQYPSGLQSHRKQTSGFGPLSGTTRDHSAFRAHRNNINATCPTGKSQLDGQSPTDVAVEDQRRVESLSCSSMFRQNYPCSIPHPVTPKNLSVINDILLSYRRLNEMRKAYCSTPSPSFFATYSTRVFSSTSPCDPLQSNTRLNLIDPKTMRQASFYRFSTLPSSPTSMFQNGRNARTYRHRYVPPLLAKLFYEEEFSHLFDSSFCHTFSTQEISLNKASELYIRRLFPAPCTNSVLQQRLDRLPARNCETTKTTVNAPLSSESDRGSEALVSRLEFPSRTGFKLSLSNHNKFQLRTFHHSLIPGARHRVPVAQWHDDLAQKKPVLCAERPSRSHHAYTVALNDRGLPSYTDSQGGDSGVTPHGSTIRAFGFQSQTNYPLRKTYNLQRTEKACSTTHGSTMRAFGFQSRTNYPFRRTYGVPRTEEMCLAPPIIPPRVSPELASRVPLGGLSTTLLHLFEPGITRGLFFSKGHAKLSAGLKSNDAEVLYSICDEGRLVPDSQD